MTPHPPRGRRSRLELAPQPGAARRSAPTSSRPDSRPADSPSLSGTQRAPSPLRVLGTGPSAAEARIGGWGGGQRGAPCCCGARGREPCGSQLRGVGKGGGGAGGARPPSSLHLAATIRRCKRYTCRAARRPPAHRRSTRRVRPPRTPLPARVEPRPWHGARAAALAPPPAALSTHPNSSSPRGLPSPTPTTTATHPTLAGARPQPRLASRVRSRSSPAPTS